MGAPVFEGGCLCASTRFRVTGEAKNRCYCHCRSCRLAAGAPFVAWGTFPTGGFQVIEGELREHRSSAKVLRGFCASCGTAISYRHEERPGELDVALATLDDPAAVTPECHIWVSQKLPWVALADGLPGFPEWPEGDSA
ncbi:MAG: GFA family protein [Myxococcota bacterium]